MINTYHMNKNARVDGNMCWKIVGFLIILIDNIKLKDIQKHHPLL